MLNMNKRYIYDTHRSDNANYVLQKVNVFEEKDSEVPRFFTNRFDYLANKSQAQTQVQVILNDSENKCSKNHQSKIKTNQQKPNIKSTIPSVKHLTSRKSEQTGISCVNQETRLETNSNNSKLKTSRSVKEIAHQFEHFTAPNVDNKNKNFHHVQIPKSRPYSMLDKTQIIGNMHSAQDNKILPRSKEDAIKEFRILEVLKQKAQDEDYVSDHESETNLNMQAKHENEASTSGNISDCEIKMQCGIQVQKNEEIHSNLTLLPHQEDKSRISKKIANYSACFKNNNTDTSFRYRHQYAYNGSSFLEARRRNDDNTNIFYSFRDKKDNHSFRQSFLRELMLIGKDERIQIMKRGEYDADFEYSDFSSSEDSCEDDYREATIPSPNHTYQNITEENDNIEDVYLSEDQHAENCYAHLNIRTDLDTNNKQDNVNKNKIQHILKEILITEKAYITSMEVIIYEYKPTLIEQCKELVDNLLGNIEEIYYFQLDFFEILDKSRNDVDAIIQVFLNSEELFKLYPKYFKANYNTDVIIKKIQPILEQKQRSLNDQFNLSSYLIKPLQRLAKYKLFLENIIQQLKDEKSTEKATDALEMVKRTMDLGNTEVAISSLLNSPIKNEDYGLFIISEKFFLLRPKRMEVVVFLFTKIVILALIIEKKPHHFMYWKSIKTTDLSISVPNETTINLTDYKELTDKATPNNCFVLNTKTQKLKTIWESEIKKILWQQFITEKEIKKHAYRSGLVTITVEWKEIRQSIRCCPSNVENHGILLMMRDFKVKKTGRKKEVFTIFIFDKILIFTEIRSTFYYYIDSVKMEHISLVPIVKNQNTILFKDHINSKKHELDIMYELEAESKSVKSQCEDIIKQCLWRQYLNAMYNN